MREKFYAGAEALVDWFRFGVFLVQYMWAILCVVCEYLEEVIVFDVNEFGQGNPAGAPFRNLFLPVVKVLVVALTSTSAYPRQYSQAPALIHFMDVNPVDGQYVFGYSSVDSSREERRHADGTVEGKYSYRDPEGKVINVSYGADAGGFHAVGDHLPPRDTPAVTEAKQKFLATYAKEAARIGANSDVTIRHPQTNGVSIEHADDSEVVLPSAEEEEVPLLVVPAPTGFVAHTTRFTGIVPETTDDKANHGTAAHAYNWLFAMDSPLFSHSAYPAQSFLIPIPLSTFGKITPSSHSEFGKAAQKNYTFNGRRGGRKIP